MEAKIYLSREKAATIYSLIYLMTGQVSYRAKREEIQKKILDVWPEIKPSEDPVTGEIDRKERRIVILTEREQKAMAEGLLLLVNKENANGADYNNCLDLAGTLRISGWFRKAAQVQEVPEFDEALDGEPAILDLDPEFEEIETKILERANSVR
jgi:hypothetical protein